MERFSFITSGNGRTLSGAPLGVKKKATVSG